MSTPEGAAQAVAEFDAIAVAETGVEFERPWVARAGLLTDDINNATRRLRYAQGGDKSAAIR